MRITDMKTTDMKITKQSMIKRSAILFAATLGMNIALTGTTVAEYEYSESDVVYADVVRAEPIYKTVTISTPQRVCEQVEVSDRHHHRRASRHRHDHDTAGGTIAGGLLGGVIGRQFGKGKGRDAMTIAGVLVGSAIGHDNEANKRRDRRRDRRYDEDRYETRTVERCRVKHERHTEERIKGYKVTYFYNGKEYQTRTRTNPGNKIRLQVNVRPVGSSYDSDYDDDGYESNYDDKEKISLHRLK